MIRIERARRKALFFIGALAALSLSGGCGRSEPSRLQGYVEGEFVYVASPMAGALESLYVQRGQQVKAGDPLFVLESAAERAARDQARAALTLSEKEFARQEKLRQSNLVAAQDLDRARSTRDQERERMTKAEWDLAQKKQTAPQAGLVFDTLYRQGEWVPAGRPIVSLLPPENIKVRAFVPETEIGAVRLGDRARVTADGAREPLEGKVSFISPRAEYTPPVIYSKETRSKLVFMIEVVFDSRKAADLHPGQPVDVQIGS
jgi:HlyD family secretion protein